MCHLCLSSISIVFSYGSIMFQAFLPYEKNTSPDERICRLWSMPMMVTHLNRASYRRSLTICTNPGEQFKWNPKVYRILSHGWLSWCCQSVKREAEMGEAFVTRMTKVWIFGCIGFDGTNHVYGQEI